jgi:lipid II:glycine glycyltransferase (peptidoglycan interpeptide bridge formation enzyme)
MKKYRTLLLDLSPELSDLRSALRQKWRNQLNRAEKNLLELEHGTEGVLFDRFVTLYEGMVQRKGYDPGVDINEFRRMQDLLPESSKMQVLLCLSEGQDVAGAVYAAIGDTGSYLHGATGEAGMRLKGSYLCQWRMVETLRSCGYRWYDLGGIDPDLNPGVFHFKSGLSGRDASTVGVFERASRKRQMVLVRLGELLATGLRRLSRIAMRRGRR